MPGSWLIKLSIKLRFSRHGHFGLRHAFPSQSLMKSESWNCLCMCHSPRRCPVWPDNGFNNRQLAPKSAHIIHGNGQLALGTHWSWGQKSKVKAAPSQWYQMRCRRAGVGLQIDRTACVFSRCETLNRVHIAHVRGRSLISSTLTDDNDTADPVQFISVQFR